VRREFRVWLVLAAVVAFLAVMVVMGVNCEPKRERSEVGARLGADLLALVDGCSRIESYRVSPYQRFLAEDSLDEIDRIRFIPTLPPGAGRRSGFVIKDKANDLTPRQAGMLIEWIDDPYSYDRHDPICAEFRPSLCFRFVRGREKADLLIDVDCAAWVFLYQERWVSVGCSRLKHKLKDFGAEFFPDYFD